MNLKELAKIAGVSPATVSLVLNNKRGVGEETRKNVQTILEEYNYTLPRKSIPATKNILFLKYIKNGMIVEENSGFISTIMDSIENDCRNQGYNLNIVISKNCLEETLQNIDYNNFQGVILLGTELEPFTYPFLEKIPIPYIVIDNIMPNFNCSCIVINNEELVYHAVAHLAALGHKDIGYFRSSMSIQNFDERALSFIDSCKKLDLNFRPEFEFLLTPTLLGAYHDMKTFLDSGAKLPGCIFADNDTIAIGAMKALIEFNYKIPNDISIIGFDDVQFAAINSPSLTTMCVPKKSIGSIALRQLHNAIEEDLYTNVKVRVGGNIIVRDSTKKFEQA